MKENELKRAVAKAAVIVACTFLSVLSYASQDTDAMNAGTAPASTERMVGSHIYVVKGDVYVAQGKNTAHRVADQETLVSDTMVSTGDNGAALLKFEDGQIVTMQPSSTFQVREYRYDSRNIENSNIVFTMFKGGMRFVTGLVGKLKKQAFRLSTPNATIGIRGTEFMVTMSGKSMYSKVLNGKIAMTNAAGVEVIGAGQSALVASSAALASVVSVSAIPAGTFSELLSIPVDPSAIPPPAPPPPPPAPPAPPVPALPAAGAAGAGAGALAAGAGLLGAAVPGGDSGQAAKEEAVPPAIPPEQAPAEKETAAASTEGSRSGMGITGKVGTLGAGAEFSMGSSDSFSVRLGVNMFNYKYSSTVSSNSYDFKLQLQTVSALADWYPFSGSFRTSAGVLYNNNKATLTGTSPNGTYTLGNNPIPYTLSSLTGTMSFNKVAPYIGIGWGDPVQKDKGWGLVSDFGILYQGSPSIDITATCSICPGTLATDLATEKSKIESDLKKFKFYPVMSLGISYQW